MKILFHTRESPFHEITGPVAGGAEIAIRRIAEEFAAIGHQAFFISLTEGGHSTHRINGVNLQLFNRESTMQRSAGPLDQWQYSRTLESAAREMQVELIHCFSTLPEAFAAAIAAKNTRVPLDLK